MSKNWKKVKSMLIVTSCGASVFVGHSLYYGNEKFYNNVALPLMRSIDPELSHQIAILSLKYGLLSGQKNEDTSRLRTKVYNISFENPLGIAAGFDKQGESVEGLHKIGFGFVEIGSVTPLPQSGNPKPRVFRLAEDKAVINRYGFNSDGHEEVYKRLVTVRNNQSFNGVIGINLGKNKESKDAIKDYCDGIKKFSDIADYFVVNVSSPNTPGLRNLQNKKNLEELLSELNKVRLTMNIKLPLLLKLSPDITYEEQKEIAEVIQKPKSAVDGLILTNTTIDRKNLINKNKIETGGVSGAPLAHPSTKIISNMYRLTNGKIPIIGVGGIFNGNDAYEKIKSGASLIQIYTSYIYHGPPIVNKIKRELNELLEKDGYSSISNAVGKAVNLNSKSS